MPKKLAGLQWPMEQSVTTDPFGHKWTIMTHIEDVTFVKCKNGQTHYFPLQNKYNALRDHFNEIFRLGIAFQVLFSFDSPLFQVFLQFAASRL